MTKPMPNIRKYSFLQTRGYSPVHIFLPSGVKYDEEQYPPFGVICGKRQCRQPKDGVRRRYHIFMDKPIHIPTVHFFQPIRVAKSSSTVATVPILNFS